MPAGQKRAPDLITDGCEPPCGCRELNSGPLEEQAMLLTTEPSLQPPQPPLLDGRVGRAQCGGSFWNFTTSPLPFIKRSLIRVMSILNFFSMGFSWSSARSFINARLKGKKIIARSVMMRRTISVLVIITSLVYFEEYEIQS